jgi:HSP20 family protein
MKEIRSYFAFSASWGPAADVYEDEKEIRIVVDIAGVDPDQLEIRVDGEVIQITGIRKSPAPSRLLRIHQMEIEHGAFNTRIRLPGWVVLEERESHYMNGFLTIVFPKRSREDMVHIPIQSE